MFAKHFYLALLTGETVRNAFVIAEQTVIAEQKSPGGGMRGGGGGDIMERGDGQVGKERHRDQTARNNIRGFKSLRPERSTVTRQTVILAVIRNNFTVLPIVARRLRHSCL